MARIKGVDIPNNKMNLNRRKYEIRGFNKT